MMTSSHFFEQLEVSEVESFHRKIFFPYFWWRLPTFSNKLRSPKSSLFKIFTYFWWHLPTFSNNLRSLKSSLFAEKNIWVFSMTSSHFFLQLEVSKVGSFHRKKYLCIFDDVFPLFFTTWGLQSRVFSPKKIFMYFWWLLPPFFYNLRSPKSSLFAEKNRMYIFFDDVFQLFWTT